ncbi:hypothetical protein JNK13_10865 [bacterium]|nr:hypothetical protein [bacterium]
MYLLTKFEGFTLLITFGLAMITLVLATVSKEKLSSNAFLVANRNVSLLQGSLSIAVAWIWAPAIFICSMQAYQNGLAGIFWFTFPNVLCFFLYAPLAVKLRKKLPEGFTFPEYIAQRFNGCKYAHLAFLVVALGYQLGAIIINALAGGTLLHAVSGVSINLAIICIACLALSYSLVSGLKASILTDVVQMLMVLGICFTLVPLCLFNSGGLSLTLSGLGGINDHGKSIFDPWLAFSMGIPMTLSLLAGPLSDQMFWQRAMAVRKDQVYKTFIYGGLLFGIVPILLSTFGFIAVPLVKAGLLKLNDPQLVGPTVIGYLLPKSALYLFCIMAFAGLCSTMDSACCAASSLGSIDIYKRYFNPAANDQKLLTASRLFMLALTTLGTSIALLQPKLMWVFLSYGALASAGMFPTFFAIYSRRISEKAIALAIASSVLIGTPFSIYANVTENPYYIVAAAMLSVLIGLCICTYAHFQAKAGSDN